MITKSSTQPLSEVISIGDELTSGQRLDTNSQWLSEHLGDIGLRTMFHTTVADDVDAIFGAFEAARKRADIVVVTGGLGPTADDLTRQIVADVAGVELERHLPSEDHMRLLFESRGYQMPENNLLQAMFPVGSNVIPNATGTAPGIDFEFKSNQHDGQDRSCRLFAFPGVPAEMKPMWRDYARPAILRRLPDLGITVHHTLHCFGLAESDVESRLPELTKRGRTPTVGITASKATITLRISAVGKNEQECQAMIEPTANLIRETLGDNLFGEQNATLPGVVVEQLTQQNRSFSVVDLGSCGLVADLLQCADPQGSVYLGCISKCKSSNGKTSTEEIFVHVKNARVAFDSDLVLVIGPTFEHSEMLKRDVHIYSGDNDVSCRFNASSNPSIMVQRSVKQALNFMRVSLHRDKI